MGAEQSHTAALATFADAVQSALDARIIDKSTSSALRARADAGDVRGLVATLLAAVRAAERTGRNIDRDPSAIAWLADAVLPICESVAVSARVGRAGRDRLTDRMDIFMAIDGVRQEVKTLRRICSRRGGREPSSYALLVRRLEELFQVLPNDAATAAVPVSGTPCPTCGHVAPPAVAPPRK